MRATSEEEMFKDGHVLVVTEAGSGHWEVGDIMTVSHDRRGMVKLTPDREIHGCYPKMNNYKFRLIATKRSKRFNNEQQKGGWTMGESINRTVAKVFDKTEDAILVTKHLGNSIPENFISELHIKGNKEVILKEAKRIQSVIDADESKTQYVYER